MTDSEEEQASDVVYLANWLVGMFPIGPYDRNDTEKLHVAIPRELGARLKCLADRYEVVPVAVVAHEAIRAGLPVAIERLPIGERTT